MGKLEVGSGEVGKSESRMSGRGEGQWGELKNRGHKVEDLG